MSLRGVIWIFRRASPSLLYGSSPREPTAVQGIRRFSFYSLGFHLQLHGMKDKRLYNYFSKVFLFACFSTATVVHRFVVESPSLSLTNWADNLLPVTVFKHSKLFQWTFEKFSKLELRWFLCRGLLYVGVWLQVVDAGHFWAQKPDRESATRLHMLQDGINRNEGRNLRVWEIRCVHFYKSRKFLLSLSSL